MEQGQVVRAGDPLFRFDTTALQRAYRQASAAYESGQLQKSDALAASSDAQAQFNDAAASLNNLAVQKDNAAAAVSSLASQYAALTEEQKNGEQGKTLSAALEAARADLAGQEQALSAAKAAYDAAQKGVLSDSGKRELELAPGAHGGLGGGGPRGPERRESGAHCPHRRGGDRPVRRPGRHGGVIYRPVHGGEPGGCGRGYRALPL